MDYAINIARLLLARLRIIWGVGLHINYLAKGALPLSLSLKANGAGSGRREAT